MSEKNPRGRPTLVPGEKSVPLTISLPRSQYTKVSERSARERKSLQTVVRESLDRHLEDDDD